MANSTNLILTIGNSYSQIKGLTSEQFRKLKKLLSYSIDPKAAYFSGGWTRVKYLIDSKGNFPSGLNYLVQNFILANQLNVTVIHNTAKPSRTKKLFNLKLINKPHKWQLKALEKAASEHRGGVVACTGSGKSLLIALIASRLNAKTLVVVPTLEIKKQLSESLLAAFGRTSNIVVENIDSRWLKTRKDFDCLIIDECHHVAAKTYQKLNKEVWNGIYYRFFLTATFFRNDTNEQLLFEGIAGQIIYKLTYQEAIRNNYIVPIEAYYIDVPKQKTDCYKYADVYSELVVNNKVRNFMIAKLLKNFEYSRLRALCLVREINHGITIESLTGISFVNGQDEESRQYIQQFNSGDKKCLVGTTGVLGEGVDTKPAEYIVIAGLGKAKSAFMQQVGRGVRTYPGKESCKVVIFRDTSHKFLLRHFNNQCKILLEEFGVVPLKLEVL